MYNFNDKRTGTLYISIFTVISQAFNRRNQFNVRENNAWSNFQQHLFSSFK